MSQVIKRSPGISLKRERGKKEKADGGEPSLKDIFLNSPSDVGDEMATPKHANWRIRINYRNKTKGKRN